MLRVVAQARPSWVVAENVPGLVSLALDDVLASLEAQGYAARAVMVPARGVGALHKRERVFVVAADAARAAEGVGLAAGELSDGGFGRHGKAEAEVPERDGDDDAPSPHGEARRLAGRPKGAWAPEPGVGRVAHGVPRRVDRLRALGNAVVPQQAYPILLAVAREIARSRA